MRYLVSNKLSSATLIELIVAMVIFSVILTLVFYTISYTQIIFDRIKNQSVRSTEAITFFSVLKNDIEICALIEKKNNYYLLKNPYEQHIKYQFNEQYTIRQAGIATDTFHLHLIRFKEKEIQTSVDIISGFSFQLDFYGHKIPFEITKKYSPSVSINAEINKLIY